jgi:hypothetical protein
VRRVPRCDPPFDDELEPQVWSNANQLALEWPAASLGRQSPAPGGPHRGKLSPAQMAALWHAPASVIMAALRGQRTAEIAAAASRLGQPTAEILAALCEASAESVQVDDREPHHAPGGHSVPPPSPARGTKVHPVQGQRAAARPAPGSGRGTPPPASGATAGASGDAKLAVRRFVHMCVEVLNGYRPAAHLRRLALPQEAAAVVAQAVAGVSRVTELRRETRAGHRRDRRSGPVGVIRLQLCEPRPGAVEAAVLLVTGERTWAMALRLEVHQQTWCATTLRLV